MRHAYDMQTACSCDDLRMERHECTIKDGMEAPIMHVVYQATRGNGASAPFAFRGAPTRALPARVRVSLLVVRTITGERLLDHSDYP